MFRVKAERRVDQVAWSRADYGETAYFVASYRHPEAPQVVQAGVDEPVQTKVWPSCWAFRCCGAPA